MATNVIVTRSKVIQVNTPANMNPPNVVVAKSRTVQVSGGSSSYVDTSAGIILSNPTMSTRLSRLRDVDTTNELQGATLVYDVETDKFILSYLDMKYIKGSLAGGTF